MSASSFQPGKDFASAMDARDPLAHFRSRFHFPKTNSVHDCIYLAGHSLGLQPKAAGSYLEQELQDWARFGVEGHFHARNPWVPYHRLLTQQTAALVGAEPSEVVVMNSLTVNLHLMMASFYRPTPTRNKILVEGGAFPSDQYAVNSQIRFHGFDPASALLELTPREGESFLRDEDIASLIEREGSSIALILLGGVNYVTGQAFNVEEITKAGHRAGCIVGFDLAHAAGNLPLHLHDWGPDFAVWCSYKYLNGGPGCVGGCFVHERHARAWNLPRFAGWWGHDENIRFQMGPDFHPMAGAEGWQLSNPPILALAPLRASMEIFAEAGMERLREKSVHLTAYLEFLLHQSLQSSRGSPHFTLVTPPQPERRGAQLSIRLPRAGRALCARLAAEGVIGDWREPDIFRVAPAPLYNSYQDVYQFVQRFTAALTQT
ncbi:MAG TPA: kynureninase [Candidatus Sulfotelmatobacter sp.]|nr:kynureninase [Candidatus Sulfotelmatobacter sp.]